MKVQPLIIGEATVICYTILADLLATGNTAHIVGNKLMEGFNGLAICKYNNEPGYYLFYCNKAWEAVTDTWHQSIEDAKDQGEFEYFGITWVDV